MLWAMMSRFIDGRRKFRTRCWSKRSKRFFTVSCTYFLTMLTCISFSCTYNSDVLSGVVHVGTVRNGAVCQSPHPRPRLSSPHLNLHTLRVCLGHLFSHRNEEIAVQQLCHDYMRLLYGTRTFSSFV